MNLTVLGDNKYRVHINDLCEKYRSLVPDNIKEEADWEGYLIVSQTILNVLEMRYRIQKFRNKTN